MSDEQELPPLTAQAMATVIGHWTALSLNNVFPLPTAVGMVIVADSLRLAGYAPVVEIGRPLPELVAGVELLDFGDRVDEGQIVIAITPLWRRILEALYRDPNFVWKLTPRQTEEFYGGAYEADGYKVVLTPRTKDGGVDIIATRSDLMGSVRILDQVKQYRPGHVVGVDDVSEVAGLLLTHHNASKVVLTTTSRFSRDVFKRFADLLPTRLSLRDGDDLQKLVQALVTKGLAKDT